MEIVSSECNRVDPLLEQSEVNRICIEVEPIIIEVDPDMSTSSGNCTGESSEENETDPLETDIERNTIFIKMEKDAESAMYLDETAGCSSKVVTNTTGADKTRMRKKRVKRNHCMHGTPDCKTCDLKIPLSKHRLCEKCNKSFFDKSTLTRHQLLHSDQRLFQCDVCDKRFNRKDYLMKHSVCHTPQYVCDVCNVSFSRKSYLKKHQLVHTSQDSVVRDKTFTCKISVQKLKFVDKRQIFFACDICNKPFIDRNTLKGHKVLHSGQGLFQCDVCDKTFNRKVNLKKHHLIHTR